MIELKIHTNRKAGHHATKMATRIYVDEPILPQLCAVVNYKKEITCEVKI